MKTKAEALEAVRTILEYIGEDVTREGLLDTPKRFLNAWIREWGIGNSYSNDDISELISSFDNTEEIYDQMIVEKDINFYSHCEHHLAIFCGHAHIAYIPKEKIVGISKLARIVDIFSKRLQVQERLTSQIANTIAQYISPDCAVMLSAVHTCMTSRGVRQPNAKTITTALRGQFLSDKATQNEFMQHINRND